jgi:sporulation protein YlmC with PRC-barrel domain
MAATTPFTIGADASCTDGACGKVSRVVMDPVARTVTHLVVEPKHRHDPGRLVPLGLVNATAGQIRLRCTLAEFENLEPAEERHFLPGSSEYPGYAQDQVLPGYAPYQVLTLPFYAGGWGMGGREVSSTGQPGAPSAATYDSVPLGEVEVRRGEHVYATDATIGQVEGLVIDPASRHVTHVLLREGHVFGRKEIAIPISAVSRVFDGVQLSITRQQVSELPPVDIDHPSG